MGYEGGKVATLVKPHLARNAAEKMAHRGGERFVELVREATPVYKQPALDDRPRRRAPGTLKLSWYQKPTTRTLGGFGSDGFESGVATDDKIGPWVEWDTKPHPIVPIPPNTRLAYVKGGTWRMPRAVRHPGTKGQGMVRNSGVKLEAEVESGLFEPILQEWKRETEREAGRLF